MAKIDIKDIQIPVPPGKKIYPFQEETIRFAIPRKATLIADEQGLGKTCSSTVFCNIWSVRNVLIICPKSLMINWEREWKAWTVHHHLEVQLAKTGSKVLQNDGVVIVNYDICMSLQKELKNRVWDIVIIDEAHYIKTPEAKRTQFIIGHKRRKVEPLRYKKMLLLTGTPMDRPIDLWTISHICDPGGLGSNFVVYAKRYCNARPTKWNPFDTSGSSNLEELQHKVKSFMVRHTKEQVAKQIPPKQRILVPITTGLKSEKAILEREIKQYMKINADEYFDPLDIEFRDAVERLDKSTVRDTIVSIADLAATRQHIAELKLPSIVDFIESITILGRKVIVFAYHRAIVESLVRRFGDSCVHIIGGMSTEDRQIAVDRFQNDKDVNVFVGQMVAAGVGITLTAASEVVFAEIDYQRRVLDQAIDRAHRIGQTNVVSAYFPVLDGSLDARIITNYIEKDDIVNQVITPNSEAADVSD